MKRTGAAGFLAHPRTLDEVLANNSKLRPYTIVKTISLGKIDYENFVSDLLVSRDFLEGNAFLCREPGNCLYIKQRKSHSGLLIIPDQSGYVESAAWIVE